MQLGDVDIARMLEATRSDWSSVGPDFDLRIQGTPNPAQVVPLPVRGDVPAPDISDGGEWALAQAVLHAEDPGTYGCWLRALICVERAGGRLTLKASSRFHGSYVQTHLIGRVLAACRAVDDTVCDVMITV